MQSAYSRVIIKFEWRLWERIALFTSYFYEIKTMWQMPPSSNKHKIANPNKWNSPQIMPYDLSGAHGGSSYVVVVSPSLRTSSRTIFDYLAKADCMWHIPLLLKTLTTSSVNPTGWWKYSCLVCYTCSNSSSSATTELSDTSENYFLNLPECWSQRT